MKLDSFSTRFRYALERSGLKQRELCERTGINRSSISTYWRGTSVPKQEYLEKIAQVLDVNPAWLMGYDVPMKTVIIIEPEYGGNGYYSEPDEVALADELLHNEDLRVLFSASRDLTEEQMRDAYKYIKYLKAQNNDDN